MKNVLTVILLAAALLAAAHIGSTKSERAHRALDQQYQACVDRWGFGTDNFRACLGHDH